MSNQMPIANSGVRRPGVETNSKPVAEADSSTGPTLQETIMGTDPPIEEAHPGLQPTLVFASYPIVLIILVSIVAIYFTFFRSPPSTSESKPQQTEIVK